MGKMKTQFTDSEVEIVYRIIRHYLMEHEEIMTHGHNDVPKNYYKLFKRLT
jgi:hypothetical protein